MTVSTLRELFVHDLEDIYDAENELLDALEQLAEQTDSDEIAEAFRDHRRETTGHVERPEQVFDMLGRSLGPHPFSPGTAPALAGEGPRVTLL